LKWQAALGREQLGQHDAMKDAIHAAIDYSRVPAQLYLNRRLVLIPDLVNTPGILNAVHAEGTYYILASPARDWNRYRTFFVHEYAHLLLDPLLAPLAEDYDLSVELRRCLGARLVPAAVLDAPSRAVVESLVNAVQAAVMARLEPDRPAEGQRPDSPFQRYFREHLAAFPASGQPLTEFVGALLAKSSPDALCAYPHDAPAPPAPPAPVAAPPAPAPPDVRETALREAENLLQEGRTLEAEVKLQTVLAAHPDDASALFGMGQALYARGDWTGALGYYARTLEQPDLPVWIRGWSLVKTGHSLVRLNRIDEARRAYTKAAALTGDDRDAAAAARRALTNLNDSD
ncbi:MAG TPA: tetratricopeptide repeat protein, partial [Acidobacteriota bacterium]|nr:tetratricopeptide repeat protein [Acidobacteriota bacterium]